LFRKPLYIRGFLCVEPNIVNISRFSSFDDLLNFRRTLSAKARYFSTYKANTTNCCTALICHLCYRPPLTSLSQNYRVFLEQSIELQSFHTARKLLAINKKDEPLQNQGTSPQANEAPCFTLTPEEQLELEEWLTRHNKVCRERGTAGDRLTYSFTQSSVGVFASVRCSCGKFISLDGSF